MDYPVRRYARPVGVSAHTARFAARLPEWMAARTDPNDPLLRFLDATVGYEFDEIDRAIDRAQLAGHIVRLDPDDVPAWVYAAALADGTTPVVTTAGGALPTSDTEIVKLGGSAEYVVVPAFTDPACRYAHGVAVESVAPIGDVDADGYVSFAYVRREDGSARWYLLRAAPGESAIATYPEDLAAAEDTAANGVLYQNRFAGDDEIHYADRDGDLYIMETARTPIVSTIDLAHAGGTLSAVLPTGFTVIDYLSTSAAEYYRSKGALDLVADGVLVEPSGRIIVPAPTTIPDGHQICPFVRGWRERLVGGYADGMPAAVDEGEEKTDIQTNVWPLSERWAKRFAVRPGARTLGILRAATFAGVSFDFDAGALTVSIAPAGSITPIGGTANPIAAGDHIVSVDLAAEESDWRYVILGGEGVLFLFRVSGGERQIHVDSAWEAYVPAAGDVIIARIEQYLSWSWDAEGGAWVSTIARQVIDYDEEPAYTTFGATMSFPLDAETNLYEYRLVDWAYPRPAVWDASPTTEHTFRIAARAARDTANPAYFGIYDYTTAAWIVLTVDGGAPTAAVPIAASETSEVGTGTFAVATSGGKPHDLGVFIWGSEAGSSPEVLLEGISLGPEVRAGYPARYEDPDQDLYAGYLGAFIVEYPYALADGYRGITFPARRGGYQTETAFPLVGRAPTEKREVAHDRVISASSDALEYTAAVNVLELRPGAGLTDGPVGALEITAAAREVIEWTAVAGTTRFYIDRPHGDVRILDGVRATFDHPDSPESRDPDRQPFGISCVADGESVVLIAPAELAGVALYVLIPYEYGFTVSAQAIQSAVSASAATMYVEAGGVFYPDGVGAPPPPDGTTVYRHDTTAALYEDVVTELGEIVVPKTILPFHPAFGYQDSAFRGSGVVRSRVLVDARTSALIYDHAHDRTIAIRGDDQMIHVMANPPGNPLAVMPFNPRAGQDAVATVVYGDTRRRFADYRIRETADIRGGDVFGDFLYVLDQRTPTTARIWRMNVYEDGLGLPAEIAGSTDGGVTLTPTYKYPPFDVAGDFRDLTIGPGSRIALLGASDVTLVRQLFRYAVVDLERKAAYFLTDPEVGPVYRSAPVNYWNAWDEWALLVGLERLPMETNAALHARIMSQAQYPPGVNHQGIVNGIAAELGLARYNVTSRTFFTLARTPVVWTDPANPSADNHAAISVWINGIPAVRAWDPAPAEAKDPAVHPEGDPDYYDALGNVAVTDGWVLWRDPEGYYTRTLEIIGASNDARVRIQYYIYEQGAVVPYIEGSDDGSEDGWIVRDATAGTYGVRPYNGAEVLSLIESSDSRTRKFIDDVAERSPNELGRIRYGTSYWPGRTGSLAGLSALYDAAIYGTE